MKLIWKQLYKGVQKQNELESNRELETLKYAYYISDLIDFTYD